jgi:hypothetical protein
MTNEQYYKDKIVKMMIEIDKLKNENEVLKTKLATTEIHKDSYYRQLQDIFGRMGNNPK